MDYKEIIFHSMEEAVEFYLKQGFVLTKDKRLVLDKRVEVEIRLQKLGPQLLRSSVRIVESPSDES
jgi:hypothetical protein